MPDSILPVEVEDSDMNFVWINKIRYPRFGKRVYVPNRALAVDYLISQHKLKISDAIRKADMHEMFIKKLQET